MHDAAFPVPDLRRGPGARIAISPGDPTGAYHAGFAGIRWAQTNALRDVPGTFQAVSLDTPAVNGWVHSPFKQPVGSRMARAALSTAYGVPDMKASLNFDPSVPASGCARRGWAAPALAWAHRCSELDAAIHESRPSSLLPSSRSPRDPTRCLSPYAAGARWGG